MATFYVEAILTPQIGVSTKVCTKVYREVWDTGFVLQCNDILICPEKDTADHIILLYAAPYNRGG